MDEYLCIDIGGTSIKYARFAENGQRLSELAAKPTILHADHNEILPTVQAIIAQEKQTAEISGICISSAGVVDSSNGKIIYAGYTIPGYTATDLKTTIEKQFGIRCEVENDVNAACLGEYWLGAGRGQDSLLCLTIGTGIGGAVMFADQLWHGHAFTACEVGYMRISGGRFQDVASTTALVAAAAEAKGRSSSAVDGKNVLAWAKAGDPEILNVVRNWASQLAEGIANLLYAFNPQMLILGGGIMEESEFLRPLLKKAVSSELIDPMFDQGAIEFARLGNEAGMIGALYHFLTKKEV